MPVVNVPPDGHIYNLGRVPGTMHVYNTNNPAAPVTNYDLTIISVNYWNANINPGHTDNYPAGGNATYIQNNGPSRLQVLYVAGAAATPAEAGWTTVDKMPAK